MLAGLRPREGGVPPPERSAEASGELDSKVESKVAEELTASVSFSMSCLPCLAGGSPSLSQPPLHSVAAHA